MSASSATVVSASSGTSQLSRHNVGAPDAILYCNETGGSQFNYAGWHTIRNFVQVRKDISAENQPVFGGQVDFNWTKEFDLLHKTELLINLGAITITGGTFSFKRFCDYIGYHMIESVSLFHTSSHVQLVPGETCKIRSELWLRDDGHRRADAILVGGGLPAAERETRANATQFLIVPLEPMCMTKNTHTAFPTIALADNLTLRIKFRPLTDVIESDLAGGASASAPISSVTVRSLVYHVTAQERTGIQKECRDEGRVYSFLDSTLLEKVLLTAANGPNFVIDLRAFRQPVQELVVFARRSAGDASDPNTNDRNTLVPIETLRLLLSGIDAVPMQGSDYNRFRIRPLYHSGALQKYPLDNLYVLPHCTIPEDEINNSGTQNYSVAHRPELRIQMADTTENYNLYVCCFYKSFVQVQSGDVQRPFNA